MKDICIAVDAMGGDNGPSVAVSAVLQALQLYTNLSITLVGNESELRSLLSVNKLAKDLEVSQKLRLINATEVVTMEDSPAVALRTKKDSSMRKAINLVKSGEAAACVSSGNTGALMSIARFVLKMLPGIDRPAIMFPLPSMHGKVHVLDLGANVECQAEHLLQFAIMGAIAVKTTNATTLPKVGLLNVGVEPIKGTEVVKKASAMLEQYNNKIFEYVGFVEGNDIYTKQIDIIVCDGFVGNVALKTSEGLAAMMLYYVKQAFLNNFYSKLVALLAKPILLKLKKKFSPDLYNGGSLLGLQGTVIKSHGSANASAILCAIKVAITAAQNSTIEQIGSSINDISDISNHGSN